MRFYQKHKDEKHVLNHGCFIFKLTYICMSGAWGADPKWNLPELQFIMSLNLPCWSWAAKIFKKIKNSNLAFPLLCSQALLEVSSSTWWVFPTLAAQLFVSENTGVHQRKATGTYFYCWNGRQTNPVAETFRLSIEIAEESDCDAWCSQRGAVSCIAVRVTRVKKKTSCHLVPIS